MPAWDRDYMREVPRDPARRVGWINTLTLLVVANVLVYLSTRSVAAADVVRHSLVTPGAAGERPWVLLAGSFFHVDAAHLVVNMLLLVWCGRAVRDEAGRLALVLVYLLGGCITALGLLLLPISRLDLPLPPADGASGTGFYVGRTLLLTNAHVVGDKDEVQVATQAGPVKGRVLRRERRLDLALIEAPDAPGEPVPFHAAKLERGQTVHALGFGVLDERNETLLLTKGTIAAPRDEVGRIVFDAKVNPGNSGGPLVDGGGRCVGVVVAKALTGPGRDPLSFAVHGQDAVAWLESLGHAVPQDSTPAPHTDRPRRDFTGAVVRLATGVPAPSDQLLPAWYDPRVFGASGAVFALACFVLLRRPRYTLFGRHEVPLAVVLCFYGLVDLTGALRMQASGASLYHGYHLLGAVGGLLVHGLGLHERLLGLRKRLRRRVKLKLLRGLGAEHLAERGEGAARAAAAEPEVAEGSGRLTPAEAQRLDDILRLISEQGMGALTPEERSFLQRASDRLR